MKRILVAATAVFLMAAMCMGMIPVAAQSSDDPSASYVKQNAEYEDSTLSLWFEHSFKKVMTKDTTPSGMDTYSVYMAKNEIENAQFILYSDTTKTNMTASVTDFTDGKGNTVSAELYYQMYVTLSELDTTSVLGSTAETTFIREGEQPDPMVPLSKIGKFQLNGGKSQAFYIRLKTTENSAPGWYSAQLNIYNSDSQQVKTATVYAYVWDFTLSEKTALQTAFYLDNDTSYGGNYKAFYDYLLENRMNAMDIPGNLDSSNEYLTNDRVQAIRVSDSNGGNSKTYMDGTGSYANYKAIYDNLSAMNEWEDIKDKLYFYTVDEAMSKEQQDAIGKGGLTVDDVKARSELLARYWKDAATVVPYHENHPYPYYTYSLPMSQLSPSKIKDGAQEMFDTKSVTIFCPQIYAFTPSYELDAFGYNGANYASQIRNLSGTISGNIRLGESYYNWENLYGDFRDRYISKSLTDTSGDPQYKLWTYCAGWNKGYTYANHLIENTGLQTKMLFWQLYQNDITGYLYYGTNNWKEYDANNGTYVDTTVTGSKTKMQWKVNKHPYSTGYSIYGNGTLFYGRNQGKLLTVDYIGSIRVEHIRDGIEEYQMLSMLSDLKGNNAAKAIVAKVSKNVVNYLSMPAFDRSAWSSGMSEYDIMAAVRIELGNAVEAASAAQCQHTYNSGTVTKAAGCLTLGEKELTCTKCGAKKTEYLPALHTEGSCYTTETVTASSCTSEGLLRKTCKICGYVKEETVPARHDNPAYYSYEEKNETAHTVLCTYCNKQVDVLSHRFYSEFSSTCTEAGFRYDVCRDCGARYQKEEAAAKGHYMVETVVPPTCTEAGSSGLACRNCDYTEATEIPATGHSFEGGKCTVCGEADPSAAVMKGDWNKNGKIDLSDIYREKLYVKQLKVAGAEDLLVGDLNGDNKINLQDIFLMKVKMKAG